MPESSREALAQIESALAELLETYAEMRSEYLRRAPEDHKMAFRVEIDAYRTAARLVRGHRDENSGMGLPSWRWHEWAVKQREISDRLDEFVVVPRSDIGTEYGVRFTSESGSHVACTEDCAHAMQIVANRRRMASSKVEVVERPVIPDPPWSVIPLPEDGEPDA